MTPSTCHYDDSTPAAMYFVEAKMNRPHLWNAPDDRNLSFRPINVGEINHNRNCCSAGLVHKCYLAQHYSNYVHARLVKERAHHLLSRVLRQALHRRTCEPAASTTHLNRVRPGKSRDYQGYWSPIQVQRRFTIPIPMEGILDRRFCLQQHIWLPWTSSSTPCC